MKKTIQAEKVLVKEKTQPPPPPLGQIDALVQESSQPKGSHGKVFSSKEQPSKSLDNETKVIGNPQQAGHNTTSSLTHASDGDNMLQRKQIEVVATNAHDVHDKVTTVNDKEKRSLCLWILILCMNA